MNYTAPTGPMGARHFTSSQRKLAGLKVPAAQSNLATVASKPGRQLVLQLAPEAITVPTLPLQPLPRAVPTLGSWQGVGLPRRMGGGLLEMAGAQVKLLGVS